MRNKGFIIFLTAIVTILCIYYLSFTWVSRNIQQDATEFATDASGSVDYTKKNAYLDSLWKLPVYNLFGIEYTYQEVKETELSLGLDLQGGMHVTLEVSPVEIIKGLSGNNDDKVFLAAIEEAENRSKTSQENFTDLFYEAYKEMRPDGNLSAIFANAANRERINFQTSDQEVLSIIKSEVDDAIDRSFNILRTRIDRFGTTQPNIQRLPGTGRIQVELPGTDNPQRVRELLQSVAKLEFWEVYEPNEFGGFLQSVNDMLVAEQKADQPQISPANAAAATTDTTTQEGQEILDSLETSSPTALETEEEAEDLAAQLSGGASDSTNIDSLLNTDVSPLFSLIRSQYGLVYNVSDTAQINRIIKREDVQSMLPPNLKFLWSSQPDMLEDGTELLELFAIKTGRGGEAPLTGEVITNATQQLDQSARPAVSMSMNAEGAKKWRQLTGSNIGGRIAIVLDNYVLTAPNVQGEIPGGSSEITGNFTLEEAKDMANLLKAGSLPAPTKIVEEAIIGPTLGREAQAQGIISLVAGLVIVVLFMVAYYAKGGLIANLALVFNIFFILGILAQLNAALTLPGIAGIVLTMGMSIDANVLIYERIREELKNGLGLKAAIATGYDKAFSSILDSNVTTFLTGLILFVLGQGPVKGFAIVLMIGIVCSFFTAVFITRVVVEWAARKGDESKLSFSLPFSRDILNNLNMDFFSKRKIAYIGSAIFIGFGMVAIVLQGGLNLGVDFTGGRSYVVSFNDPVVASELKIALADDFENAGTEVKTYGSNNVLKVTTGYLINDESVEADARVRENLIAGVEELTGLSYVDDSNNLGAQNFTISSSSKVSATIASDIKSSSIESVIFSLIAIFLYILIRFRKWQYGLGAVIALFHDALAVISAFALAGLFGKVFEIDQVFIAAILTVIGYSINDTVVVFDRIREDIGLSPTSNLTKTFNLAINNTLSRTLITAFTTLIVVIVLFIWGGEVLRGFSFALLVGIVVGTYSSIFIASPIVLDLSKRELAKKEPLVTSKA